MEKTLRHLLASLTQLVFEIGFKEGAKAALESQFEGKTGKDSIEIFEKKMAERFENHANQFKVADSFFDNLEEKKKNQN